MSVWSGWWGVIENRMPRLAIDTPRLRFLQIEGSCQESPCKNVFGTARLLVWLESCIEISSVRL